ncbi:hypothetical protein ACR30T_06375 [Neisseria gonorrhoeae]
MPTLPPMRRQPRTDGSVANFRLTTQSAPNARTSAPCRALQSLYKPMTCNDHGSTSAPVFPSRCGSFGQAHQIGGRLNRRRQRRR